MTLGLERDLVHFYDYGGVGENISERFWATNLTNETLLEEETEVELNWWALLTLIVPILALSGNLLVILAVRSEPRLQTRTNGFLVSLAATDLLVALLVMPPGSLLLLTGKWVLGAGPCLTWLLLDVLLCTASILHLATLSVDRYLALKYPWRFGRHRSRTRLIFTIAFVWAAAVAISLPLCLKYAQAQESVLVRGHCLIPDPSYRLWASVVCFYVPLLAMSLAYGLTVHLLRKQPMPERHLSIPLKRRRLWQPKDDTSSSSCTRILKNAHRPSPKLGEGNHSTNCQFSTTETDSASFSCELCSEENQNRSPQPAPVPPESPTGGSLQLRKKKKTAFVLPRKSDLEFEDEGQGEEIPSNSSSLRGKANLRLTTSFDYQIPPRSSNCERLNIPAPPLPNYVPARNSPNSAKPYWDENVSRASWRLLARLSKNGSNRRTLKSERKATKVLGVVFFAFVFLWLPFFGLNVVASLWPGLGIGFRALTAVIGISFNDLMIVNEKEEVPWWLSDHLIDASTWLGWVSSLINPLVYTTFNQDFRSAFTRLILCRCRKHVPTRV